MANQKISELNSIGVGGLDDSDLFALVDSSATETKHIPWISLKVPLLIGAKVIHSVNSTGMDFTGTGTLFWDTEVYDTHGFHAAGATNYRLTVPPVFGGMYFDIIFYTDVVNSTLNKASWSALEHYNGAGTKLTTWVNILETSFNQFHQPLPALGIFCNSGDYFQTTLNIETDTSVDVTTKSEFTILLRGQ